MKLIYFYNMPTQAVSSRQPQKGSEVTTLSEKGLATNVQVNSGDSNIQYVGSAAPGTPTSANTWRIQKIDSTTGTVVTWADGNTNFDNIWDNRESLTYS